MIEIDRPLDDPTVALVWIDHGQAIIAARLGTDSPLVERLGRGTAESASAFEARTIEALRAYPTVAVSGLAAERGSFERALIAASHRPDRVVDVEPGIDAADIGDLPARRLAPRSAARSR
jgi:hypothetical protein